MSKWLQTQYQESLEYLIHSIFPQHNILSNTKKPVAITNPHTGEYLEVDVWVPDLNLCFEFQDYYHYKPAWYSQIPFNVIQKKDDFKRRKLMEDHLTLIAIPCWWFGDSASLRATMHFNRPDLELHMRRNIHPSQSSIEIHPNPPPSFFLDNETHLMLASFPESSDANALAQKSWWIGEKWDGIRCFWENTERQLYSRNKIAISLLPEVHTLLGNVTLDAELWCGRGSFGEAQAVMAAYSELINNPFMRLLCFDEASFHAQYQPFEARYSLLLSHCPDDHPTAMNAPRFLCLNEATLRDTLYGITVTGGEGVVLRQPMSYYVPGRSKSLFKIKTSYEHNDQEARVVSIDSDGSLLLQTPNGNTFVVDKNDCMLHRKPERGDIVTFRVDLSRPHQASTQGLNTDYSTQLVYRFRSDLSWDDVLRNYSNDSNDPLQSRTTPINSGPSRLSFNGNQMQQHTATGRVLFDNFAAAKGMDPLNPIFWYCVTPSELVEYDKKYETISNSFGGKLSTTLKQIYPDIGLQLSHFKSTQPTWTLTLARRKLFDRFAQAKGMDPLSPRFWYNVSPRELMQYDKRYKSITKNYGGKLSTTIASLYPSIGIQLNQFKVNNQSWKYVKARRALFDKFAASKGMDPLNPVFWYSVAPSDLKNYNKRFTSIYRTYGRKLSTILTQLYPDIGLQKSQFSVHAKLWSDASKRRAFFDKFATAQGMDSLNPLFWYNVTPAELVRYHKGYNTIYRRYGGRLSTILPALYPDLGLQPNLFKGSNQSWKHEAERRAFFDGFAASKGVDPLNPTFWYTVTPSELTKYNKAYETIAASYGGTLINILTPLYPNIGLQLEQFKEKRILRGTPR